MHLVFKKVVMHNFLSFGHAELELTDKGYCLVKGINNCPQDNAISNGAGKSTFSSAICWALFGETINGVTKNIQNIFVDEKLCYVELHFAAENKNFIITRYKEPKSDLKIIVDGEDKSGKGIRESEAVLALYLPDLTVDLVASVIILGQGLPHKFSDNSPSGRKDILEKLTHSDFMIQDLKEKLAARVESLSEEKRQYENQEIALNSEMSILSKQLEEAKRVLDDLQKPTDFDQKISETNSAIAEVKTQASRLGEKLNEYKEENIKLDAERESLREKQADQLTADQEDFNAFQKEYLNRRCEFESKQSSLTTTLTEKKAIKDICPTCGQKIPGIVKPDTSLIEKELTKITEQLNKLNETYNKQSDIFKKDQQQIRESFSEKITVANSKINQLVKTINDVSSKIHELDSELLNLTKELTNLENNKKNHLSYISKTESQISNLSNTIEEDKKKQDTVTKKKETVNEHLSVLSSMNTLIKRDFRGFLLSNIIQFIDKKAKEYAKIIFNTDDLSFELNNNNIDICFCKKDLESLSGGEKQKVNLIIQFAIRDMMSTYLHFTSNILILDEITDNLDAVGAAKLLELIASKLQDIESIFIISHHPDELNLPCDSEVVIVKDAKGISRFKE